MKAPRVFATLLSATLLSSTLVGLPSIARAEDDAVTESARQRFQEGVKLFDAGQFERARAAFLQAYALRAHPAVLLNLAQSELRSGHNVEAMEHFTQFLRENPAPGPEHEEATKGLAAARAKVAEVTLVVDTAGAQIGVDGVARGTAPLPGAIFLTPGEHTITAQLGERSASQAITTTAGSTITVKLALTAAAATAPAAPASETPPSTSAGDAAEAAPADTPADTERLGLVEWYQQRPIAWAGTGLTILGLGLGVGFAIASNSAYDQADQDRAAIVAQAGKIGLSAPPCRGTSFTGQFASYRSDFEKACHIFQEHSDSGDNRKTVSIVSFVVGGVAAAGTVAYYFIDNRPKPKAAAERPGIEWAMAPVVAPGEGGLTVFGSF